MVRYAKFKRIENLPKKASNLLIYCNLAEDMKEGKARGKMSSFSLTN
jgi:hypothetical protein